MKLVPAILASLCLFVFACASLPAYSSAVVELSEKTPGLEEEWPSSSPDEQGIDGAQLKRLREVLSGGEADIRSVLVVRHGKLVFEYYGKDLGPKDTHLVNSVTKSFFSALIGIALDKGLVRSLDQPISDFFPEALEPDVDPRVRQITVANLLTMSSGFEWSEREWIDCLSESTGKSACAKYVPMDVRHALRRPMLYPAGQAFNYDDMNPYLLPALLKRVSGMDTARFIETNLFEPLGVQRYAWWTTRQGDNLNGRGLYLCSRDLAKFGQLYLKKGMWSGRQLISERYVQASTSEKVSAYPLGGYGYLWWASSGVSSFSAKGAGGQSIGVYPEFDLVVVVTTSNSSGGDEYWINDFVLPAILR